MGRSVMTHRNRAADARLRSIEKALQAQGHKLNATIRREDAGDPKADTLPVHAAIRCLMEEASSLRPASSAGLAIKARIIVGAGYDITQAGYALLHSLASDLDAKDRHRQRRR